MDELNITTACALVVSIVIILLGYFWIGVSMLVIIPIQVVWKWKTK